MLTSSLGMIVPVEVKSGTRTRAKSLASYITRYRPEKAIKLAGTRREAINNILREKQVPATATVTTTSTTKPLTLPLYDAAFLPGFLG